MEKILQKAQQPGSVRQARKEYSRIRREEERFLEKKTVYVDNEKENTKLFHKSLGSNYQ